MSAPEPARPSGRSRWGGAAPIDRDEVRSAVEWATSPFDADDEGNPFALHEELQELMQAKVGIARTGEAMTEAIEHLAELRRRLEGVGLSGSPAYHPGWNKWIALHSLLFVSEAVARAARDRPESRGAHTRMDHPEADPELDRVNIVVRREEGEIRLTREQVPDIPGELRRIVEDEPVSEEA